MRPVHPRGTLLTLALTAALAPACGKPGPAGSDGTNGYDALVSTTTLAPGDANCPTGGTEIDTGVDDGSGGGTAGDGVLQSGEITSTSYVCNPSMALVKATALSPGDANCPEGGTRIDTGYDDGSGGGTANDGILQPGEITSTAYDCNDPTQQHIGSFDPPPGAEGTSFIDTSGGDATADASSGGYGGALVATMDSGSAGGHIKLFKTGQVDASFSVPAPPANFDYGTVKLDVTSEVDVKVVVNLSDTADTTRADLTDGDVVVQQAVCDDSLYVWHAAGADTVDGVHIASNGLLLVGEDDACAPRIVHVAHAFVNEGQLATATDTDGSAHDLTLHVGSYYGAAGSTVNLHGNGKSAGTPGGDGGHFELDADMAGTRFGGVTNLGTIDTSGGAGDDGGAAGGIVLLANSSLYNTGDLLAQGANAATLDYATAGTTGGDGASIEVVSLFASIYNSGTLDASGGNGSTSGGHGGSVVLDAGDSGAGNLTNSGAVLSHGGDADSSCNGADCHGGDGGVIDLGATGTVQTSGNLSSYGGPGRTSLGGNGGLIRLYAVYGTNVGTVGARTVPGGAIWVSGDLDAHGGDGAEGGGDGGGVSLEGNPSYVPVGQEITLLGYGAGFDLHGGTGAVAGGDGGASIFSFGACASNDGACLWPAGSIINYVDIDAHGGDASAGNGGGGGPALWQTLLQNYAVGTAGTEKLINHGAIDANGGQGSGFGGGAGVVDWQGLDGVDNEGNITANGGEATGSGGTGGQCTRHQTPGGEQYGISLVAVRGPLLNTGDISNSGGDGLLGDGGGGDAGGVYLQGFVLQNSGDVTADGGNGNTTAGFGGNARNVVLTSTRGTTDNSGALSATGGTGAPDQAGHDAYIVVDGQVTE